MDNDRTTANPSEFRLAIQSKEEVRLPYRFLFSFRESHQGKDYWQYKSDRRAIPVDVTYTIVIAKGRYNR